MAAESKIPVCPWARVWSSAKLLQRAALRELSMVSPYPWLPLILNHKNDLGQHPYHGSEWQVYWKERKRQNTTHNPTWSLPSSEVCDDEILTTMAPSFSLKDWFKQQATFGKPIRVLDRGVSTHLEHILSQKNEILSNRYLRSSSLLLTEKGRQVILTSHVTFYRHGSDILFPRSHTVLADGSEYRENYGIISNELLREFHWRKLQMVTHGDYSHDAIAFKTIKIPCSMEVFAIVLIFCKRNDSQCHAGYSRHGNRIKRQHA